MLRPARPADAQAVASLLIAARRTWLPYAPSPHSDDAVHGWVQHVLLPDGGVSVWEADGQIVGVLATAQDEAGGWIEQLYLLPGHAGQGIGSQLLAHAHATLPRPVQLYTFQQNDGARRFYERHGYQAVQFRDGSDNEEHCPDVLYRWPG
ncbi:Ribosomal protein S18 acetylase RimI [Andreprevotia lacus DSM 23236]|jgi:GNAT superfamily N-acetyltransferase|uniref:Ribosomal protein S18 acetylase RimI n=1 Tax=Andreprevotia lacus DSM 23236 TaxID=1121001 RepID=A0A1W1X8T7_9NEIS|nr:GNAT family N-acetyltransferase [Andreprevotia lacus]SMC20244.1 Ribosomal protein S18 acetylase RimI [Andreprevotia lacus DSM 23236]